MFRVYECDISKKGELTKLLEADPYSEDSFARVGYKVKDGASVGEDPERLYVCISASEDFLKKADERLKDLAKPAKEDVQKRVMDRITEEEERVGSGVASISSMFDE